MSDTIRKYDPDEERLEADERGHMCVWAAAAAFTGLVVAASAIPESVPYHMVWAFAVAIVCGLAGLVFGDRPHVTGGSL